MLLLMKKDDKKTYNNRNMPSLARLSQNSHRQESTKFLVIFTTDTKTRYSLLLVIVSDFFHNCQVQLIEPMEPIERNRI